MSDPAPAAIPRTRRNALARLAGAALLALGCATPHGSAFAQDKDLAVELAAAVPSGTSIVVAEQNDQASVPWKISGVARVASAYRLTPTTVAAPVSMAR